jgi:hypothetical protein
MVTSNVGLLSRYVVKWLRDILAIFEDPLANVSKAFDPLFNGQHHCLAFMDVSRSSY